MRSTLLALWLCACVTIATSACVAPDEDESTSEGALIDDFGSPDNHHCPSGGGGGGAGEGGPGPKPDRKVCTDKGKFPTVDACQDCCYYNMDHVDGWECRRKRTPAARERCWREANEKMAKCNRQCEWDHGGITTVLP